jgi:hypothetical protein
MRAIQRVLVVIGVLVLGMAAFTSWSGTGEGLFDGLGRGDRRADSFSGMDLDSSWSCRGSPQSGNSVLIRELQPVVTPFGIAGYAIDRPGHYVLSQDLVMDEVDIGILVSAPATLDLDRHTLRAPAGEGVAVQVEGSVRVTIRNGGIEGGRAGIVANVDVFEETSSLRIERVDIRSALDVPSNNSVLATDVKNVSILSSSFVGAESAVVLSGWHMSDVSGSRIIGRAVALVSESDLPEPGNGRAAIGRVQSNYLEGREAIRASFPGFVKHNTMVGAADISGAQTLLEKNTIVALESDNAVTIDGVQIVLLRNEISGGAMAALEVLGDAGRIAGNVISGNTVGIEVGGAQNLIEGNSIGLRAMQCGILFPEEGENVYRENVFLGVERAVCGEPNIDGGENRHEAACPPPVTRGKRELGEAMKVCGRDPLGRSRRPLPRGNGLRAPVRGSCDTPVNPILISDLSPVDTAWGPAALVIDRPGYYVVSTDLVIPELSTGILITASEVTLDLDDHSLVCEGYCYSIVRVVNGEDVRILNGIVSGGLTSVSANDTARLTLESMSIRCHGASLCEALIAEGIGTIEVHNSQLRAYENWSVIRAARGRIMGNEFNASEGGLLALFTEGGEIAGNLIHGDYSLAAAGDNVIKENVIIGNSAAGEALGIMGIFAGSSLVTKNIVDGGGGLSIGVGADGSILADNLVLEGGILVGSSENEVIGNTLWSQYPPQEAAIEAYYGSGSDFSGNMLVQHRCGIRFGTDGGQRYGRNVVLGSQEGVCGYSNLDIGGNILPESTCGNGLRGPSETCDGIDRFQDCGDFGYDAGTLFCNTTCNGYDPSSCIFECGNGTRGGTETCDGADLAGQTCESLGFMGGGTLACAPHCTTFDVSDCRN